MLIRTVFLLSMMLFVLAAGAQNDTVSVKGIVSDKYTGRALSGVSIVNPQSNVTSATDADGFFETRLKKQDVFFLFYPGYHTVKLSLADSTQKSEYRMMLSLEPLSTGLSRPVVIRAPKTLEEIEEERKRLGITPRELERPETSFTSPISALYEILSNRAREREKLKEQMVEEDKRKILRELLRYYNENQLTDLPEENFDDFITYSNLSIDFLKYSSDYEITKTLITLYNKYGRDTGLIKQIYEFVFNDYLLNKFKHGAIAILKMITKFVSKLYSQQKHYEV